MPGPGIASAAAFAARPAAATQMGWGYARGIPVPFQSSASPDALSCGGVGDCVVGGSYQDSSYVNTAYLVAEKNGTWQAQQPVPGLPVPAQKMSSQVYAVSCSSPGNCTAGGTYQVSQFYYEAFVVDEVNGTWGQARQVPGIAALNTSNYTAEAMPASVDQLSCSSGGNCAAIGTYTDANLRSQVFVADETDGTWGTARPLPGFIALNTATWDQQKTSALVSCWAPGACAAVGTYAYATSTWSTIASYVALESGGTWSAARKVSGTQLDTVSCTSGGTCVAAGEHYPNAAFVTEVKGTWSAPRIAQGISTITNHGPSSVTDISCVSTGNCAAVGTYFVNPSYARQAFVVTETRGTWGRAQEIPGFAALNIQGYGDGLTVSCDAPGSCSAGGDYTRIANSQGFITQLRNGRWGNAQPVAGLASLSSNGIAVVTAISCGAPHSCAAAGHYGATWRVDDPFVVNQIPLKPTATALVLSGASAVYGNEQTVRAAVAVSASSGAVGGTVTVHAGGTVACVLTLRGGTGSCALRATGLSAGLDRLTATYAGGTGLAPSTSAAASLAIRKASTLTALALSPGSLTYGHEQAERLAVKVSPRYRGTPGGRVTVKAGGAIVCVITLSGGKGSCTMTAKRLPPGTYSLVASYPGNTDFTASTSGKKPLTVTS
jgi:hypothetical protein